MYDMSGFSYDITDVVHLLQLRVRHKNSSSMDVNCPFCGETKGKMNVNLQKNVFRCNRCDASGGMLELHGRLHGVSSAEANRQIREALGKGEYRTDYQVVHAELFFKTGECSSGRRNRGRCNREVIICEGMCYSILCICVTLLMGTPIAILICRQMSIGCYGKVVEYSFPFFYMSIYVFVLLLIQVILSIYQIREQKKKSIIDQLRME